PGGSPNFPPSRDRVEGFTRQVAAMGITIVDSIPALLKQVDVVMLESVDGSQHLEQVRPVFKAGKRVFIDKPFTASLVEALMILELSKRSGVPFFSCSSKRYQAEYNSTLSPSTIGKVYGCDVYGTSKSVPNHPDLFWYGVHGCEVLSTVMGPGLESVTAYQTPTAEHVRGTWRNGRIGTFRGLREEGGKTGFGLTVFGDKKVIQSGIGSDKEPLLQKMAHFFLTGETPLPPSATIEVFALMQAAEASKASGGKSIVIADFIRNARKDALKRLATP
ncbi:MAG: Gfo/Idh/MocA family oxidoreductase, partial [Pirellulaceae bacterium]|nr:Gfo/Idh/MocA family oxidoreductase [Pirellulaceae bacterium]